MTCEDARIIAAAPKHLEICRLQLATTVMERDQARAKIKRAANALKHHHMARPGIAAIVQLLTENATVEPCGREPRSDNSPT
jgi:bifunctional pyridoxal-dependent enzyme with beta-cystathionase and maltose regulon repressor activities